MKTSKDVAGSTPAGGSTVAGVRSPEGERGVAPSRESGRPEVVSRKTAHSSPDEIPRREAARIEAPDEITAIVGDERVRYVRADLAARVVEEPPRPSRINYRCSRCGVAEASGPLPPEGSGRLAIYPLPAGWVLVPCPDLEMDDHLHCAVCAEKGPTR